MRRVGLVVWLLRVALPAIVMLWSGRAIRTLRLRIDGLDRQWGDENPVTVLVKALGWGNVASTLLLLLLILELLRLLAR